MTDLAAPPRLWTIAGTCPRDGHELVPDATGTPSTWETRATCHCPHCKHVFVVQVRLIDATALEVTEAMLDLRNEPDRPSRRELIAHAHQRGPVRLADGRTARIVRCPPRGPGLATVELPGGAYLNVEVRQIVAIEQEEHAA